jgi:hypothetical protein
MSTFFGSAGYPPLLPVGCQHVTEAQLRTICVDNFPLSTTRATIMAGLESVIGRLSTNRVVGELWIDGSFLTQKINPNDSDVVLFVQSVFCDKADSAQRDAINWMCTDLKSSLHCDSYVSIEYPPSHPLHWDGVYWKSYWMRQWGFSEDVDPILKGIAVISL